MDNDVKLSELSVGDTFQGVVRGQTFWLRVDRFSPDRRSAHLSGEWEDDQPRGWVDCDVVRVERILERGAR